MLGGTIPTLESHSCQYVFDAHPFDGLVIGVVGEPARMPWHRADRSVDLRALARIIEKKVESPTARRKDLGGFWQPQYHDVALNSPRERLRATLADYRVQESALDISSYFYLEQFGRRFLTKGPTVGQFGRYVHSPYLDHEWVESILSVPASSRVRSEIQKDMIRRMCPALLEIPFE